MHPRCPIGSVLVMPLCHLKHQRILGWPYSLHNNTFRRWLAALVPHLPVWDR